MNKLNIYGVICLTESGIECFLAICRNKTVSAAAQSLYITQSSLSIRLKALEKELGGSLFYRKNGGREITLTPAGKKFYELAIQYEALINQMQQICKKEPELLRVSSLNSLGTYFLPEVYDRFLQKFPHFKLEIQDMELETASNSIFNGLTDIAFTSGSTNDKRLSQIPIFAEPMVLITGEKINLNSPVRVNQLACYREVIIEWSSKFANWHQNFLGSANPQITVSIMAQLRQFMEHGDYWSIVPLSVANGLEQECKIKRDTPLFKLPTREVSVLIAAQNKNTAVEHFLGCIKEILIDYPTIKALI